MSETNRGGRREFLRLTAGVAGVRVRVRLRLVDGSGGRRGIWETPGGRRSRGTIVIIIWGF
jgi:hypothetical protein